MLFPGFLPFSPTGVTSNHINSRHIWTGAPETNPSRPGGANFAAKCNIVLFSCTIYDNITSFADPISCIRLKMEEWRCETAVWIILCLLSSTSHIKLGWELISSDKNPKLPTFAALNNSLEGSLMILIAPEKFCWPRILFQRKLTNSKNSCCFWPAI